MSTGGLGRPCSWSWGSLPAWTRGNHGRLRERNNEFDEHHVAHGGSTTKGTQRDLIKYRCRLVVQETRTSTIPRDDVAATTSSIPLLEVVRLFCTLVLRGAERPRHHRNLDPSQCSKVNRYWYGTSDAGQAFESAV